jgi:hypothetical protein
MKMRGVVVGEPLCPHCQERQIAAWLGEQVSHKAALAFLIASERLKVRCACCSCTTAACGLCFLRRVAVWIQEELPDVMPDFGADFGVRCYDAMPRGQVLVP